MTDIEEMNRYNAVHYIPWGDNEDVEFSYEPEDFEDWLARSDSKNGGRRAVKSVKRTAEGVKKYFAAMQTLSESNLRSYKYGLQERDVKPTTINNRIIAVKLFVKFLADKYKAPQLTQFKANIVKTQPKQFIDNVISRADYDYLIAESRKDYKNPNVYLGAKIMGTTGVRRCELLQVKVEHIKHGYLDVIGKGGKQRRIYFPKNAREEILEYLSHLEGGDGGYIIRRWNNKNGKKTYLRNTRDGGDLKEMLQFERTISRTFELAGVRLGIAPELMHPHGFRHFFAKEFLKPSAWVRRNRSDRHRRKAKGVFE